jgi:hypothetical protein
VEAKRVGLADVTVVEKGVQGRSVDSCLLKNSNCSFDATGARSGA